MARRKTGVTFAKPMTLAEWQRKAVLPAGITLLRQIVPRVFLATEARKTEGKKDEALLLMPLIQRVSGHRSARQLAAEGGAKLPGLNLDAVLSDLGERYDSFSTRDLWWAVAGAVKELTELQFPLQVWRGLACDAADLSAPGHHWATSLASAQSFGCTVISGWIAAPSTVDWTATVLARVRWDWFERDGDEEENATLENEVYVSRAAAVERVHVVDESRLRARR